MNEDYESAYEVLKDGETATYRQITAGAYIDGAVLNVPNDTPITCYCDQPTLQEVQSGLALIEDAKVLIAAKALGVITPKLGELIVLSDKTLQVKKVIGTKSLDGTVVLWTVFCMAG